MHFDCLQWRRDSFGRREAAQTSAESVNGKPASISVSPSATQGRPTEYAATTNRMKHEGALQMLLDLDNIAVHLDSRHPEAGRAMIEEALQNAGVSQESTKEASYDELRAVFFRLTNIAHTGGATSFSLSGVAFSASTMAGLDGQPQSIAASPVFRRHIGA